jgi:hypothetical protein
MSTWHPGTCLSILLLTITIGASAQQASEIMGQWKSEEKPERLMEFFVGSSGIYYARVVYDESKEGVAGKTILKDLRFDELSKTFSGIMMPPDGNLELNATIKLVGVDRIKIVATKLFMTKTLYLRRIPK